MIATYRADESTAAIDALVAGLPTHLVLSPLDREALGTVVTDMLGGEAPDPALAEIFWDRTEGNPFFASEYLRACVEEGLDRAPSRQRHPAPSAISRAPARCRCRQGSAT
ncbi:MAG: hypothetical protein U0166_05915 [Acidobacteriota bacterium]